MTGRLEELEPDLAARRVDELTVDEWVELGTARGWCATACGMHDLPPMTADERGLVEEGGDPCIPVLRVWPDDR